MTIRRLASKVVSKLFVHKDPKIEREFAAIYQALARLDMGNFSWNYDKANRRLVLQVWDENTTAAKAVWSIDEDGAIQPLNPTYATGTPEAY